jgi:hypothetical protein
MKRAIWIGALAVLAFAAILAMRLPASWISSALPKNVVCAQVGGTIWNGACDALAVNNTAIGDVRWQLHALPLLTGKIASLVEINGAAGSATAEVEARSGNRLTARNLRVNLSLDPALLPQAPPNLRGKVQADLARLSVENGRIVALEGRIDAQDLKQLGSNGGEFGDYVVTFPAARVASQNDEPIGDVRSVKGPYSVEGTLKLTREPGFALEGLVAPGPGATPEVLRQLSYLGTPDAQGRRTFSVAGTF